VTAEQVKEPYEILPERFGFAKIVNAELESGTPEENAVTLRCILMGEKGALRNVIVMNSAAALVAGDVTTGLREAARLAEESIDSGRALDILNKFIEVTQKLG
jgi:anthranilate phosphoribosyltransferase